MQGLNRVRDCAGLTVQAAIDRLLGRGEAASEPGARLRDGEDAALGMAEGAKPPDGNTGVKSPEKAGKDRVGLDWLQGTFPVDKMSKVKGILQHFFGEFMPRERAVFGYLACEATAQMCFLLWTEGRADACVSIPGACMSQLDAFAQMSLLLCLSSEGFKASRMDVAYDDKTKSFTPGQFSRAFDRGQCCGFRVKRFIDGKKKTGKGMEATGETCELGRRGKKGGGRQVVIYDKEKESGGVMKSVRIEARFFKDHAQVLAMVLLSKEIPDDFEQALREAVGGAVDFRIRQEEESHKDRLSRPRWWSRILARLGEARVSIVREKAKLEQSARHLQQAYAPTMATLAEAFEMLGGDFFEWMSDCLDNGVDRQGKRHELLLRQYLLDVGRPVSEVDELMEARKERRASVLMPF